MAKSTAAAPPSLPPLFGACYVNLLQICIQFSGTSNTFCFFFCFFFLSDTPHGGKLSPVRHDSFKKNQSRNTRQKADQEI